MPAAALEIVDLQAWYGESHILHNVNLTVNRGEVVTLLGRNGAGRSTTLRAMLGLTGLRKGSIKINGVETIGSPAPTFASKRKCRLRDASSAVTIVMARAGSSSTTRTWPELPSVATMPLDSTLVSM